MIHRTKKGTMRGTRVAALGCALFSCSNIVHAQDVLSSYPNVLYRSFGVEYSLSAYEHVCTPREVPNAGGVVVPPGGQLRLMSEEVEVSVRRYMRLGRRQRSWVASLDPNRVLVLAVPHTTVEWRVFGTVFSGCEFELLDRASIVSPRNDKFVQRPMVEILRARLKIMTKPSLGYSTDIMEEAARLTDHYPRTWQPTHTWPWIQDARDLLRRIRGLDP